MSKTLANIFQGQNLKTVMGHLDKEIKHISFDSRDIQKGTLFIAVKGLVVDGHSFIDEVIQKGVVAVLGSEFYESFDKNTTYIQVENTSEFLGKIASVFYDEPSKKLKVVGVTGTNGKTTIASLLHKIFISMQKKSGLLSTINIKINEKVYPTTHTTPDAISIHRFMKQMVDDGCEYCFMEVSSHGIAQGRINEINFTGGIFTNISHDHLDYHKTFKDYINVKKSFFDNLPKTAFVLSNQDDKNSSVMLQNTKSKKYLYALKNQADFKMRIVENSLDGLVLNINNKELYTRFIGTFNAYNLLAIYGTCMTLGYDENEVLKHLSLLTNVDGRFQYIESETKIIGIVDYAHTPDALENVLQTIKDIQIPTQQLITVVGCGGNRDKDKRPKMAKIACSYSQNVIFTSDNPRFENPDEIITEMEKGLNKNELKKTISITNRKEAIKLACKMAREKDIILVAGKGHETYQEIEGVKYDFNDIEVLEQTLKYFSK